MQSLTRVDSFIGSYSNGGIMRYLGPHNPAELKKVIRVLIMEPDNLFHVVVNPPPILPVMDGILGEHFLEEQYDWTIKQLQENTRLLFKMFTDLHIISERTKDGVIHIHCVAKLREGRLDTDIKRTFWQIFNISTLKERDKRNAMKSMVHYEEIRDEGIIAYLFDKDKKDYETIYNKKNAKGEFYYMPYSLFEVPQCAEVAKEPESDEGTDDDDNEIVHTQLILRKRVIPQKKK